MKVSVVSRKLIKPCKPTPSDLCTYKISLIDEVNPSMHVTRIFFYESDQVADDKYIASLEESLSQVLPLFYPLAGRYNKEEHYVNCNDEGAAFLITETTFLKAWANAATNGGLVIRPDFDLASYFPSENKPSLPFGQLSRGRNTSILSRRFVFDKNAIHKLRERVSPEWRSERPPSRVQVVSAVLTQAILRADRVKHGQSRASIIRQAINVRERIIPPVSKYSCGTWVCTSFLESDPNESYGLECNLATMVSKMREANIECIKDCARILSDREFGRWLLVDCELEAGQRLHSTDNKVIWISDLSKFEDFELDFGFGKPIWATVTDMPIEDFIVLMNTKHNDGIEAWVYMHESDMPYLDQDEELRMLTTQRGYAI
ncbi:UNVERIFIED_CONTAM: Pelargonidin 3-O-(6-caffeoylglucoside) 5-O-(6-O-malonylglucoside) 4'''-malonyltransferase [Sesamum radiatum]|uniref:Pelargonidin 3-O-(6-caffeoylglucoside) 5-O-(6-O-malonylglucoside) 4'''-malonyltransferase n=1 Tax=Sesamum radiatum TaxID=300843 RepID=A0AAW2S663_SESRA